MSRPFNFSAGPATLPESVLLQAREELLDWQGTGMSVMEMSHRGKAFVSIAEKADADLRELMAIPDDYHVLFLQGGATAQFALIPMNLAEGGDACYVNSGMWARKAIKEAKRHCRVNVIAEAGQGAEGLSLPGVDEWPVEESAAYLHYTANETIDGLEIFDVPDGHGVPVISDMSSTILSRPVDVRKFGLIYAGAQKNIGPAGLAIVIVHKDLLGQATPLTPDVFNYAMQAGKDSMLNTPPTYTWYLAGLVFQWLKQQGGLAAMAENNHRKSERLYSAIDQSGFYHNGIAPAFRSRMNIPFTLANPDLDKTFLDEAAEAGLLTLKGHRSVGGMRASLYNAMPEQGVVALVDFMKDFERRYG